MTCPECGMPCDIPKLIARKWVGPWYRAPGFTRLIIPVAWPALGWWVVLLALTWELVRGRPLVLTVLSAAVVGGGWLWSLWRIRNQMPGGRALLLSGLAHLVFAGYVGGVILTLSMLLGVVRFGLSLFSAVYYLILLMPVAALFYVGRRLERFIAERCIRQDLIDGAKADTMSAP